MSPSDINSLIPMQSQAGSHPNFVSLVGMTTVQGGPTCLLLEYIPNGRLDDFLNALREGPIPEWYVRFVRDTVRGAYHKHVSGDLMRVLIQVAEGMVSHSCYYRTTLYKVDLQMLLACDVAVWA